MAKRAYWKSDWLFGLLVTVAFIAYGTSDSSVIQGIERWAYDLGVRSTERAPADNIAIIAIDDTSLDNLGRWPWPRSIHAEVFDRLQKAGAKVIAPALFYSEPQIDPGYTYLEDLQRYYLSSSLAESLLKDKQALQQHHKNLAGALGKLNTRDKSRPLNVKMVELQQFYESSIFDGDSLDKDHEELTIRLSGAIEALNQDRILSDSLAGGKVILPMLFALGFPQGRPDSQPPEYVMRNIVQAKDNIGAYDNNWTPYPAVAMQYPIAELGEQAAGIAHLNQWLDSDGGIRTEPLIIDYHGQYYPSFALLTAAKYLNLEVSDIQVSLGEGIQLNNLAIGTDNYLYMRTFFYADKDKGNPAFTADSFFDIYAGKIPVSKYKGKIVLIGPTAAGISTPQKTPVDKDMYPVISFAHSISSILNEDFFVSPAWTDYVILVAVLGVIVYLIVILPRMAASIAASVSAILITILFATEYLLMTTQTIWMPLMYPLLLLLFGHVLLTTKRFLWTEHAKESVEADSSETNRMLGIAFQSQGQLDMAFEKYRKCATEGEVFENLYGLALDYERKRQFNKSANIYRYISEYEPDFKDVNERLDKAVKLENTAVFGAPGSGTLGATVIFDDAQEKPMLGRFKVEKELGKGAMGMVYLGRDPQIDRDVAIKTMALSQEFEGNELIEAKSRFFREAKSAGRLNHPNIVTIYDTGEEHDLAFIAMELLKGDDLELFVDKDKLLPIPVLLEIFIKVADALDYAHKQNIVHRDIKPANIMYNPDDKTVKVTDFGIARITDASKTRTGIVLGTPSYMSPEQLSGKHIDGRSDLFSMGIMMYQLLTGTLPFRADTLASLMFKIASEDPEQIMLFRSDLPECLVRIVNKSLLKPVEERYQTGEEMKASLEECASIIKNEGADWVIA